MEHQGREHASIKSYTREGLAALLQEMGQPKFRAKQLEQWLYGKGARSFDEMTNLSAALRSELKERFDLPFPTIIDKQVSRDGSRKYLLALADGTTVETVGMPGKGKLSVCVSSQAGCPMGCVFCATGEAGLTRNLACGEIVDQVRVVAEDFGTRPTNVVIMGQGEPFLNYENLMGALRYLNSPDGMGIGARHITVSTCGIIPKIKEFSREPEQFTLAISLHSAVQKTRNRLMPGVVQYTLPKLKQAVMDYAQATGRRPSFEFALIKDINDSDKELEALVEFTSGTLCHVNLIQLNEIPSSPFKPVPASRAEEFARTLMRNGVETTIRVSRGQDIDAACGQLSQKHALKEDA